MKCPIFKRIFIFAFLLTLSLCPTFAQSAEKFDPATGAKIIAPFIDENTVLVVHADLTRVQVDPIVDEVTRYIPEAFSGAPSDEVKQKMHQALDGLLKPGVKDIYCVLSMTNLPKEPLFFVVMPLYPGSDEKAIVEFLKTTGHRENTICKRVKANGS
jgi:hypothetical protein